MATTSSTTGDVRVISGQSNLRKYVFALALPAVGEQFLNMLVGLVDTFLVGHLSAGASTTLGYTSAAALAGVGLAGYVVWITTSLFAAVGSGTTALIARAIGGGDELTARAALRQSLILGLLMGLLAAVGSYVFAPDIMRLLGAQPDVQRLGVQFLRITALSMPLSGLLFVGNAALRGAGDTRTPLLLMLIVNGVNIVIALLFVNGGLGLPTLGVVGSAWGATIGRGLGGLLVIIVLLRGHGILYLRRWPTPDLTMLRRILRIGLPTGAEQLVFQGAIVIMARLITGLGTAAYAAHNTVITIESVSFLPGFGFGIAATTLVGQSLGANDIARARASTREAVLQGGFFMGLMGLLFIAVPRWLMAFMVNDPAVINAGATPLRLVGVFQIMLAANFIYSGALRGAGDTRFPLLVKLISPWLIRLPLAFVLTPMFGLIGVWLAMTIDMSIQGVAAWWRFRSNKWEKIEV